MTLFNNVLLLYDEIEDNHIFFTEWIISAKSILSRVQQWTRRTGCLVTDELVECEEPPVEVQDIPESHNRFKGIYRK